MKYKIEISTRIKKDYKLLEKRGYNLDLLKEVIATLANGTWGQVLSPSKNGQDSSTSPQVP